MKDKNKIKIIFMSNADFGAPSLEALAKDERFEILSLITIKEKETKGSKKTIKSPILDKIAWKHKIQVWEVSHIRDEVWEEKIKQSDPDLMIVASFGQIIPKRILDIPKCKTINIHPSLLSKHRGPSPIQTAILNGDKKTGVTIMLVDEEMDHGEIIAKSKTINIERKIYEKLHDELAKLGAALLMEKIPAWVLGKIKTAPQDHGKATYTKKISKEDGNINWDEDAETIEKKIRAYHYWPGAYSFWQKTPSKIIRLIFLEADPIKKLRLNEAGERLYQAGEIFVIEKKLAVKTKDGALIVKYLKPEGKKEMESEDFLKGNRNVIGSTLK